MYPGRKHIMSDLKYGFETTLAGVEFGEAQRRVTEALQEEGFGVLTEIDVKATLKKKLDAEFRPYVILGACNPVLAKQALEAEPHVGLLLPCNVVVQEAPEGGVIVSIADPKAMFTLVEKPNIAAVANEAEERLRRVIAKLEGQGAGTL